MYNRDIHVLKYFSSFISVSKGKVINITDPVINYCPLAKHLYQEFTGDSGNDKDGLKCFIKKVIESKIKDFGFFTDERKITSRDLSIPYGASEILSFALRKNAIDAAVVVCEGAGTVIASRPEIVQGIGGRMNSLLLTSPIKGIIEKLKNSGCSIIFENALIDQLSGVKTAIKSGYKNIAVTICGQSAEDLKTLRALEKENKVRIISLAVCTTGLSEEKIGFIQDHADLVWSCVSSDVCRIIGPLAVMQLSRKMPVFVLSKNGADLIAAYADEPERMRGLDLKKQYLFSNEPSGQSIHLGNSKVYIRECQLPVTGRKEPILKSREDCVSVAGC